MRLAKVNWNHNPIKIKSAQTKLRHLWLICDAPGCVMAFSVVTFNKRFRLWQSVEKKDYARALMNLRRWNMRLWAVNWLITQNVNGLKQHRPTLSASSSSGGVNCHWLTCQPQYLFNAPNVCSSIYTWKYINIYILTFTWNVLDRRCASSFLFHFGSFFSLFSLSSFIRNNMKCN